jgi:hypothetical protein
MAVGFCRRLRNRLAFPLSTGYDGGVALERYNLGMEPENDTLFPVTTVVHCKKEPYDVYIGRPSKWGNPFVVGEDGERGECVELFREWIVKQPDLLADLHELRGKVLGCWCKPSACHGDVLAKLADDMG